MQEKNRLLKMYTTDMNNPPQHCHPLQFKNKYVSSILAFKSLKSVMLLVLGLH